MSKLSEYSKFDHLDSDDDDKEEETARQDPAVINEPSNKHSTPQASLRRDATTKRFLFEYDGKVVYEWEQSLSEVVVYVPTPPVAKLCLDCHIGAHHLRLGLVGAPTPFIDEPTFGKVDTHESTWCLEQVDDDSNGNNDRPMIVIYLQKAHKGVVWDAVLTGRFPAVRLNPVHHEQVQKELLLERYGEDHPGFDFRDADFNGSVPDPRTFMGGVQYK